MELETVQETIRSQGWTPRVVARRHGLLYLYAGKRQAEKPHKMKWRYICPVSRIESMSEEQLIEKVTQAK